MLPHEFSADYGEGLLELGSLERVGQLTRDLRATQDRPAAAPRDSATGASGPDAAGVRLTLSARASEAAAGFRPARPAEAAADSNASSAALSAPRRRAFSAYVQAESQATRPERDAAAAASPFAADALTEVSTAVPAPQQDPALKGTLFRAKA